MNGLRYLRGLYAARSRRLRGSFALPMRYRRLRIAASVCGSIAAVLLIALWLRSYWRWDSVSSNCIGIESGQGIVMLAYDSGGLEGWWFTSSYYGNGMEESARPLSTRAFEFRFERGTYKVFFAHWLLLVPVVVLTLAPWMRWRFSLRTLLVATTLVAIGCGILITLNR